VQVVLTVVDVVLSAALIGGMFAAMFKVLPDTDIAWRDVAIGALASTVLFEGGKYAIAFYIGQSNFASSYGAAGALIVCWCGSTTRRRFSCLARNSAAPTPSATGVMPIRDGGATVAA
jgi:hypothetical protein